MKKVDDSFQKDYNCRKFVVLQWVVTSFLCILIVSGYLVYQGPYIFGATIDNKVELASFLVISVLFFLISHDWHYSNLHASWKGSFESVVHYAIKRNSYLGIKEIKERTISVIAAIILLVVCFIVGSLFNVSHYWLSFLVPVFASILATNAIDEMVNNWTYKTIFMVAPCFIVFAIGLTLGSAFTGIKVADNLIKIKYVIEFGVWISNGFLGVMVLYVLQRLLMRFKI